MTNRLVLGNKGGNYGLWVSKPGVDVLTASETDMLLSSNYLAGQVLISGSRSFPGDSATVNITVPNFGFYSQIITACDRAPVNIARWTSPTNISITMGDEFNAATGRLYWFLLNLPGVGP